MSVNACLQQLTSDCVTRPEPAVRLFAAYTTEPSWSNNAHPADVTLTFATEFRTFAEAYSSGGGVDLRLNLPRVDLIHSAFVHVGVMTGGSNKSDIATSNFIQSYFHGTKVNLGRDVLPGNNRITVSRKAKFVYASSNFNITIWGAELAVGDGPKGYMSLNRWVKLR